ncbi:flavin reductase family protein [Ferrovibrio sp.]|uniref:flavin reductase family protein n=1 Tax=Ferrovibrio sp. TaxID=1917215 RepID=UPI003D145F93
MLMPQPIAGSDEFILAMRQFPAAVGIITSGDLARPCGLTATAIMSLTADPPQIAVAVNRNASAYPIFMETGIFCVNLLTTAQTGVAQLFSSADRREERFASGQWHSLATGAPVLDGSLLSLDCTLETALQFSSHALLVGQVAAIAIGDDSAPLLYMQRQWAGLLPQANLAA